MDHSHEERIALVHRLRESRRKVEIEHQQADPDWLLKGTNAGMKWAEETAEFDELKHLRDFYFDSSGEMITERFNGDDFSRGFIHGACERLDDFEIADHQLG